MIWTAWFLLLFYGHLTQAGFGQPTSTNQGKTVRLVVISDEGDELVNKAVSIAIERLALTSAPDSSQIEIVQLINHRIVATVNSYGEKKNLFAIESEKQQPLSNLSLKTDFNGNRSQSSSTTPESIEITNANKQQQSAHRREMLEKLRCDPNFKLEIILDLTIQGRLGDDDLFGLCERPLINLISRTNEKQRDQLNKNHSNRRPSVLGFVDADSAHTDQTWISLERPTDTIGSLIFYLTNNYELNKQTVVFTDQSFASVIIESYAIRNQLHFIHGSNATALQVWLKQHRKFDIENFIVFGSLATLSSVLLQADQQKLITDAFKWFLITSQSGMLQCSQCRQSTVYFFRPIVHKSSSISKPFYRSEVDRNTLAEGSNEVNFWFYHDLMQMLIENGIDYVDNNKINRFKSELNLAAFYGRFGRFAFESHRSFQEVQLKAYQVNFWNTVTVVRKQIGNWIPEENNLNGLYIYTTTVSKNSDNVYDVDLIDTVSAIRLPTVTMIHPPFVMKRWNGTSRQFEFYGYCIDLLDNIRLAVFNRSGINLEFDLYEVPDGQYGVKDLRSQQWNGMIGEIQRKIAKVAVGPVYVMAERESVVDFTVPFYDLVGISLLMKKPISESHMFKFLTVLENDVWFNSLILYLITSICLFLTDYLSPISYQNSRFDKNTEESRIFTLKESLWFCITSLTPQGGGEAPMSLSGRMVAASWWIYAFVLLAIYTANLAAFLTVARLDSPVETLEHLSNQYRIRYATIKDSTEETYFLRRIHVEKQFYEAWKKIAYSKPPVDKQRNLFAVWDYPVDNVYTNLYKQMKITTMPLTFEEGVRRVRRSEGAANGFALIAEATKIKWMAHTNCDLVQNGDEFSRRPMALAVQENDTLRESLNSGILQLLNERKLEAMKEFWWNDNEERKICEDPRVNNEGISIKNVGGVFVIIFGGVFIALTSYLIEKSYTILKANDFSISRVLSLFSLRITEMRQKLLLKLNSKSIIKIWS